MHTLTVVGGAGPRLKIKPTRHLRPLAGIVGAALNKRGVFRPPPTKSQKKEGEKEESEIF